MAELVDALVSGTSGSNTLEVRVFLCPPYVKEKFWGCSSVGRALRSQCRGREFESHQLHHEFSLSRAKKRTIKKIQCRGFAFGKDGQSKKHYYTQSWGYGGMVDAEDLKSFDHCDRVGSSPTIPTTKNCYRAQ